MGPDYLVFVSSFHSTRLALGASWKMPTLDNFVAPLLQEKNKLNQMRSLKTTNVHALSTNQRNEKMSKQKPQVKGKKKSNPKVAHENSYSKDGKIKKEKELCAIL